MHLRNIVTVVVAVLPAVVAIGGIATWTNSTGNTPDTAYLWSTPENWENGVVGGEGDVATIQPSAKVFITNDVSTAPGTLRGGQNAYILNGMMVRQTASSRAEIFGEAFLFGDIYVDITDVNNGNTRMCYIDGSSVNFCGRVHHNGDENSRIALSGGSVNFRCNQYANSSSELRTDDLDDLNYLWIGNGLVMITAPEGADAANSVWRLTEGSPFAYRVSGTAHTLVVGTTVTADGYLAGSTYLKHMFDDATIELSAPAMQSGDVNLSFAAFTPIFTPTFKNRFGFQGLTAHLIVIKKRQQDTARVTIKELCGEYGETMAQIGSTSADIPGTFVIDEFTGTWKNGYLCLNNVDIELDKNASADANLPFIINSSSCTARLTVTNNLSSSIAVFKQFNGTLVKGGTGSLAIGFNDATNTTGHITVEGGTFTINKNNAAGDGELMFGNLTLSDGVTLVVPTTGIRVAKLATSGNVTISGGKVTVVCGTDRSGINFAGITLANGAKLEFVVEGDQEDGALLFGNAEPQVVGHPAFWVDASKPETLVYTTENDVNYVTRWNDCRAGEPMFCTNIVLRPTYKNGSDMKNKYVRIANVPNVTDYRDTQQLVWSEPIRGIKAVFLVQDPSEGGGMLLGRCEWRLPDSLYNSWGGPFFRESSVDLNNPIVEDSSYTIDTVRYGRFYLNGRSVPVGTCYLGAYMQLIEFHANTNYPASSGVVDCDAFGGCYHNGVSLGIKNGGMRIAEYIIYTNSLSHAERVQVAQYLSRKWLGKNNIYYLPADQSNTGDPAGIASLGGVINVPDGKTTAISAVTSGSITKSGAGTLYVNGLDGASLDVEDGSVTLAATTRQRYVPTDAWIHVDATEEDKISIDGNGNFQWNDVNGSLASYRNFNGANPTVELDCINGLPAVDLGPLKAWGYGTADSKSTSLVYYTPEGQISPGYSDASLPNMSAPYIYTAFLVYNSSAGGGTVLGGGDNGYPSKGLPHQHSKGDDSPIIDEPDFVANDYHGLPGISNAVANGTAIFRRNGVDVDPFTTPFLKGNERVTFKYSTGRKTTHLCWYGYGQTYGGLKYGEVALFDRVLTTTEINGTEAYLAKKWFGIDTPGYGSAADAVTVADGASLTVLGPDFSAASLGGSGSVTGDVTLEPNGGLVAEVKPDGTIGCLTVDGAVKLSGGGTVSLVGQTGNIVPGVYPILRAGRLTVGGGSWTLPGNSRYAFTLSFADNVAYLKIDVHGMRLIFR